MALTSICTILSIGINPYIYIYTVGYIILTRTLFCILTFILVVDNNWETIFECALYDSDTWNLFLSYAALINAVSPSYMY
jgi:hypothetical protein